MSPRYRRATDSLAADLGQDQLAVMGLAKGRYYTLNAVARSIWEFLDSPRTTAEIRAFVGATFDVDVATCERDADHFLKELLEEGLAERA